MNNLEPMQYIHPVHFTLSEVQTMLPRIITTLKQIQELKKKLDTLGYDLRGHQMFASMGTNGTHAYPPEVDQLATMLRDMNNQGLLIKDVDHGIVDFPTIRPNGEEVYLCYRLGEKDVAYWHRTNEGFSERQAIDRL